MGTFIAIVLLVSIAFPVMEANNRLAYLTKIHKMPTPAKKTSVKKATKKKVSK